MKCHVRSGQRRNSRSHYIASTVTPRVILPPARRANNRVGLPIGTWLKAGADVTSGGDRYARKSDPVNVRFLQ